jgi:hypothetical protein
MKSDTIVKAGAICGGVVVVLLVLGMLMLHEFGSPKLDSADLVLKTAVMGAGAANIVCAVVLDIRGYDTLGEATLLLAAVTGVVLLLAKREDDEKKQPEAPKPAKPVETKPSHENVPPWVDKRIMEGTGP